MKKEKCFLYILLLSFVIFVDLSPINAVNNSERPVPPPSYRQDWRNRPVPPHKQELDRSVPSDRKEQLKRISEQAKSAPTTEKNFKQRIEMAYHWIRHLVDTVNLKYGYEILDDIFATLVEITEKELQSEGSEADSKQVKVIVDGSIEIGEIKPLQNGICSGPIPIGAFHPVKSVREYYAENKIKDADVSDRFKEMGIKYVRLSSAQGFLMNRIFPRSGNKDADPDDPNEYEFKYIDHFIKPVLAIGAVPYITLEGAIEKEKTPGVFSTPPEDNQKWAEVAKHIVMHVNKGWANGHQWGIKYWEIWNEPDLNQFWSGTNEQYLDLYSATAHKLKEADSSIKVGGPGLAWTATWTATRLASTVNIRERPVPPPHRQGWRNKPVPPTSRMASQINLIELLLEYCAANSVPIDFISWHAYYLPAHLDAYKAYFKKAIEAQKYIDKHKDKLGQLENILSEWNIWADGTWPENYSSYSSSHHAAVLSYLQDSTVEITFRYSALRGQPYMDAPGAIPMFFADGTPKKAFYTYKMFNIIMDTPVRIQASGSDQEGFVVLAGKSQDKTRVSIILTNFKSSNSHINLKINNLPWGKTPFTYEYYLLDDTNNLELIKTNQGNSSFDTEETLGPYSVALIKLFP